MNHHTPRRLATLSAALLTLAAACGSDDTASNSTAPSNSTAQTATATAESAVVEPGAVDTVGPVDTAAAAPSTPAADGDICATVPPLDVISAQLDEPVLRLERLERGPGTELCEAAGDGVANVSFTRVAVSNEQQMRDLAAELGYEVSEVGDPALPGAFTYAGAVTVFVGETEFTVQAITLDTISDPTSAVAIQRSSTLLAAWLQLLGVSPA